MSNRFGAFEELVRSTYLVNDNIVLKSTIPLGAGNIPEEHPHLSALAIGGSGEVGVVGTSAVLDTDSDTIVTASTLSEVVGLEVKGGLGEAVAVGDVVDSVDDVEGIHLGSGEVSSDGRSLVGVLGVDELARGGLSSSRGLGTFESNDVVTTEE